MLHKWLVTASLRPAKIVLGIFITGSKQMATTAGVEGNIAAENQPGCYANHLSLMPSYL